MKASPPAASDTGRKPLRPSAPSCIASVSEDDCPILEPGAVRAFQGAVLDWYRLHGRKDLPWQTERTPYRVWVSEIMLQQTRVETVIPYFERFVTCFPDVRTLATAHLDQVLERWAGLGYYARARNLHRAAVDLVALHQAQLPSDLTALTALPGIGRSTAGAIASMGHGLPAAILDGNVKRVLCRYWGVDGWPGSPPVSRLLWSLSERLTPAFGTDAYNQAMMDLGATVCTPRNPACPACPLAGCCSALLSGRADELPAQKPRRPVPVRHAYLLVLHTENRHLYLERRQPSGIWGGLWSLPLFEHRDQIDDWNRERGISPVSIEALPVRRHTFSHFHLDYVPVVIRTGPSPFLIAESGHELWHAPGSGRALGLPAPVRTLLLELGYLQETG